MSDTDLELLARYTRHHAEDAFAEIVRRHLDLVHSAALRQVGSSQLAEEVAQSTFINLARNARRLAPGTILTAWLYQLTRREAIDVVRREARRQAREQIATEMNTINAADANWTHIEPLLDEAMDALDDTDRSAVLLRYFENKSLREVGAALGTSDDAAQKRVSRAVERLREFFSKRGITVGAGGLVVVISSNAVQAAPSALAITISTAATLTGTSIAATSKGAALVKSAGAAGLAGSMIGPVIGSLGGAFGAYMSIKNTKSSRERQFMIRSTWLSAALVVAFGLALFGLVHFGRSPTAQRRELFVGLLVVFALIYCATLLCLVLWTNRRQRQIQVEDGTYVEPSTRQAFASRPPGRAAIYGGLGGSVVGATAWLVVAAIRAQDWWGAGIVAMGAATTFALSMSVCLRWPRRYWSVVALLCVVLGVATLALVNVRWSAWFANNPEFKGWTVRGLSGLVIIVYAVLAAVFTSRWKGVHRE